MFHHERVNKTNQVFLIFQQQELLVNVKDLLASLSKLVGPTGENPLAELSHNNQLYINIFLTFQAYVMLEAVEELSRAVAVSQHHDAITGTEKQHVANDYHRRLHNGMSHFMEAVDASYCPFLNISQCHVTDDEFENVDMLIYNNLAHTRSSIVCCQSSVLPKE